MELEEKVRLDGKDTDDTGYSEAKVDQDIELQAGQWLDLKQKPSKSIGHKSAKPHTPLPQSKKHQATLQTLIQTLTADITRETEAYLSLIAIGDETSEEVFQRISSHLTTLKALLKALKWDNRGELNISKLPKEVQNLLK